MDAAVLAEVLPRLEVVTATEPAVRAAVGRAWKRMQDAARGEDRARQITHLEQMAGRARQRLTRATEMYVDGSLERDAYEALAGKARTDLEDAQAELERLRSLADDPALPPLETVLAQVGGWRQVLLDDDVETRRRVLALIIQTIIPERVRPGEYRVQIAWTPSGELLRQLVDQGDSAAA